MLCYRQNRELQIMRLVSHPNVVELRAFFYSNGERVCWLPSLYEPYSCYCIRRTAKEGWSLPQLSARICSRNCLPSIETLRETQADHAHALYSLIHVSTPPISSLHPLSRWVCCVQIQRKNDRRSCYSQVYAIEISNLRTFSSILKPASLSYATLVQPRS